MVRPFKNSSIRGKLFWLAILNSGFVLLVVGLFLFGYERIETRDTARRGLASQAGIVADSCAAALAFSDDKAATETLTALRGDPNIAQAAVYGQDGRLFAAYSRGGADTAAPPRTGLPGLAGELPKKVRREGAYFENGYVSMWQPIRIGGQQAGSVYLKASLKEADSRLGRNMEIVCLVLLASLVLSLILSAGLQVSISRPIADLSRVARSVSIERDYSARAVRYADDEIGFLVDSFNGMLSRIEAWEQALRESEERYALAARGSNDGLWDWKLTTDAVYFSPRWNQMPGYEEAQSWQHPEAWFQRIHPSDRDRVRAEIAAHRDGHTAELVTEYRIRQKSGVFVWVLCRGIAVRDADGVAVRMAGSQTDITQGKVADPLTGLPNRLYFLDRLENAIETDRRKGMASAVLYLDLDRFKLVNDSMGHAAGDALLTGVSSRLRHSIQAARAEREADDGAFVARLGGDEFAMLLNGISRPSDATRLAERVLRDLTGPFEIDGRQVFAGVSSGVALTSSGATPEELLRNADTAMYHAKTAGKSRFAVFDDGMREQAVERLEIETELRKAVAAGEMRLQFQPQFTVAAGRLTGFEALVRWHHPERGVIPPGEFIPVAEETGMIVPIGQWVLREACRQMTEWQARIPLDPALTIAVNVSFQQLTDKGFVEDVGNVLKDTGLLPRSLRLEMTESVVMSNPEESVATLRRLKDIGVALEIDDFGTGYSSLSYLTCLPIDTVKVDRSFVSGLGTQDESAELVRTILELARSLNLDVVAEGVETETQLRKLRELDCARAQGFYFARPLDAAVAAEQIEAENLNRGFRLLEAQGLPEAATTCASSSKISEPNRRDSNRHDTNRQDAKEMKRQSETVAGAARLIRITVAAFAAVALAGLAPEARAQAPAPKNIFDLSLEDLMNVDVTSVSKKDQTLAKTGAAVFVINREDIRRSGAANIPDVLRMAPGVEVAQVNANQWAISIRGFNAIYSNKVLVLIDGRAVYVDQFSGVYWDQVDVPLEDIERIEVIRGPGGTVWGANAVNGVINIITRSAADTKGALVAASAGTRQTAAGLVQYGADAGSTGAWRIFGKYFNDDDSPLPGGRQAPDGAHSSHAGFRIDQSLSSRDTLSVQGDFITSSGGETTSAIAGYPPAQASFNNLLQNSSGDGLARWEHTQANGSEFSLQISDSDFSRHESGVKVTDNALDIEFEHHLHVGDRHDIVWGLDYRSTAAGIYSAEPWSFQVHPPHRVDNLLAGFVQDEIRIAPSLFLTVGSKIEHNDFTGVEFEPGVQLVWAKSARQSVWASASRAVREPDVFERYIQYPLGLVPVPGVGNALLVLEGNPAVGAEHLTDFEVGYRSQLNSRTSIDLTGFLSYYNGIETNEPGAPYVSLAGGGPSLVLPLSPANLGKARDYGIELFGNWQATRHWKISPGLSVLRMSIGRDPGSNDASILQTPGNSPRQQFEIRSLLNLSKNLEWDSSFKYVADLAAQNIAGYARLDTRLGWKFGEHTEISVSGQNLTSPRHFEFFDNSGLLTASEAARSVFGKLTWRY